MPRTSHLLIIRSVLLTTQRKVSNCPSNVGYFSQDFMHFFLILDKMRQELKIEKYFALKGLFDFDELILVIESISYVFRFSVFLQNYYLSKKFPIIKLLSYVMFLTKQ